MSLLKLLLQILGLCGNTSNSRVDPIGPERTWYQVCFEVRENGDCELNSSPEFGKSVASKVSAVK